jgi:hypothetical protein
VKGRIRALLFLSCLKRITRTSEKEMTAPSMTDHSEQRHQAESTATELHQQWSYINSIRADGSASRELLSDTQGCYGAMPRRYLTASAKADAARVPTKAGRASGYELNPPVWPPTTQPPVVTVSAPAAQGFALREGMQSLAKEFLNARNGLFTPPVGHHLRRDACPFSATPPPANSARLNQRAPAPFPIRDL